MVGHKKYLSSLIKSLKDAGVRNYVKTEFFQGHTSRWGLAWTFLEDLKLQVLQGETIEKKSDSMKPLSFCYKNIDKYPTTDVFLNHLRSMFDELEVIFRFKFVNVATKKDQNTL